MKVRRLTLKDLQLEPSQIARMRGYSSEMRQDLWDSLEHCCLTEINEEGRKAVIRMRKYLMFLTLHPTRSNELPFDRTPRDETVDRQKKFFTPRV